VLPVLSTTTITPLLRKGTVRILRIDDNENENDEFLLCIWIHPPKPDFGFVPIFWFELDSS
jgi:hypothetical protein